MFSYLCMNSTCLNSMKILMRGFLYLLWTWFSLDVRSCPRMPSDSSLLSHCEERGTKERNWQPWACGWSLLTESSTWRSHFLGEPPPQLCQYLFVFPFGLITEASQSISVSFLEDRHVTVSVLGAILRKGAGNLSSHTINIHGSPATLRRSWCPLTQTIPLLPSMLLG